MVKAGHVERVSELVGRAIVSATTGEKVGAVTDVLVELRGERVLGIVVRHGALGQEQVLPYSEIQTVGPDAVIARSHDRVLGPKEWHELGIASERSSAVRGKAVVTDGGRRLGRVRDVYVDEAQGRVHGYEVERPALGGLIVHRAELLWSAGVTIGPDAVVVSNDAARVFDRDQRDSRTH